MFLNKVKIWLQNFLYVLRKSAFTAWRFCKAKCGQAAAYIKKVYHKIPASNRIKVSVLAVFGVLILLIVALLCVPNSMETLPEGVTLQSRKKGESYASAAGGVLPGASTGSGSNPSGGGAETGSTGSGSVSAASASEPWHHTSDAVPPTLSVPDAEQPAGGVAYTPSIVESTRWEQIMTYLDVCESFQFGDADKEQKLAVGAMQMAIANFNYISVNAERTEFWIDESVFENNYYLLAGQYYRGSEMENIQWQNGSYRYTLESPIPTKAAAEITSVYRMENDIFRVEGIVTRGLADEAGSYSRQMTVLLQPAKGAYNLYFVLGLDNAETAYTSLPELTESSVPSSGSESAPATVSSETSQTVSPDASSSLSSAESENPSAAESPAQRAGEDVSTSG